MGLDTCASMMDSEITLHLSNEENQYHGYFHPLQSCPRSSISRVGMRIFVLKCLPISVQNVEAFQVFDTCFILCVWDCLVCPQASRMAKASSKFLRYDMFGISNLFPPVRCAFLFLTLKSQQCLIFYSVFILTKSSSFDFTRVKVAEKRCAVSGAACVLGHFQLNYLYEY